MPSKNHRLLRYLLPVMFALLAYGFAVYYLVESRFTPATFTYVPQTGYDVYASYPQNWLAGNGWRDCIVIAQTRCDPEQPPQRYAYRLPGYSLLLLPFIMAFGVTEFPVVVLFFQAALAALTVLLVVRLALRFGLVAALITGAVLVVNTAMYYLLTTLYTEIFFTWVLVIFVYLLLHGRRRWQIIGAGLVLALLLLTRGVLVLAVPLLIFALRERRQYGWLLLGAALPVLLWGLRNLAVLGVFVLFSTGVGEVLWGANNPVVYATMPGTWMAIRDLPGGADFLRLGELEQERALIAAALDHIRSVSLPEMLRVLFYKVLALNGLYDTPLALLRVVYCLGFIALGGAISLYWRGWRWVIRQLWQHQLIRICLLLLLVTLLNTLIYWADYRFRYPIEPYLALLAGAGAQMLWAYGASRRQVVIS